MLAQRVPVEPVHVLDVEKVAVSPPYFVKDLIPLFGGHAVGCKPCGRDGLSRLSPIGRRVVKIVRRPLSYEHLRAVIRQRVAANVFGQQRLFAVFQRIDSERSRGVRLSPVIKRRAYAVKQMPYLCAQPAVIVRFERHSRHSRSQPVEIYNKVAGRGGQAESLSQAWCRPARRWRRSYPALCSALSLVLC